MKPWVQPPFVALLDKSQIQNLWYNGNVDNSADLALGQEE